MTYPEKILRWAAAAALAATLSGCASDDQAGRFLVSPDKYAIYNCPQLSDRATFLAVREKELRELMAKAGSSPDGRLVSTVAYQPEYAAVRGEMNELHAAVVAKKCKFVPGVDKPGAGVSDKVIR